MSLDLMLLFPPGYGFDGASGVADGAILVSDEDTAIVIDEDTGIDLGEQ